MAATPETIEALAASMQSKTMHPILADLQAQQCIITEPESNADIVKRALEAALDAACKVIQDALGVTAGDFASIHFSGPIEDVAIDVPTLRTYLYAQRHDHAREQAEKGKRVLRGAGNAYMLETAQSGKPYLLSAPIHTDGSIDPQEWSEVEPWFTSEESGDEGKEPRAMLAQLLSARP